MDSAAPDGKNSHNDHTPSQGDFLARIRQKLLARLSIRQRLAMWYATLLAVTLVLFSVIVYTVAQNQLQTSVNEEIKNRAVYIASALQGAQDAVGQPVASTPSATASASPTVSPSASASPTSTVAPGTTPNTTVTVPTPIPTVDPRTSQNIQKKLSIKVPDVLGRIDLGFEVLDVKGRPKYTAPALNNVSLPLNDAVIAQALHGTAGMYTANAASTPGNTTSLLAIYVQPITISSESTTAPEASGTSAASPTGTVAPTATISANDASQEIIGVVLVAKPLDDVNGALSTLSRLLIIGSLLAILFASLGGWLIAESGLRPIPAVTRAARTIAASAHRASLGIGTRVNYSGPRDEVANWSLPSMICWKRSNGSRPRNAVSWPTRPMNCARR